MNTRAAKHNAISSNSIEVSPAVAKSFSWSVALAVAAATTVESAPTISSNTSLFFDESPPAGAVAAPSSWSVALAVEAATTVEPAPMISSTISLFFDAVHVATGSFYAKHTMDVVVHEHFIHRICPDCVLACTKPTLLSLID